MTERMTVALEDGTRDKLIELSGGERKIGSLVSDLTASIYEYWRRNEERSRLRGTAYKLKAEDIIYGFVKQTEILQDMQRRDRNLHELFEEHEQRLRELEQAHNKEGAE